MSPSKKGRLGTAIVFSLHPHKIPRHGGQLRLEALLRQYRKAFSVVVPVAIYSTGGYPAAARSRHDIPASLLTLAKIHKDSNLEAWILGRSPREDPYVNKKVRALIKRFKPSVLIFEQPYLFEAISEIVSDMKLDIPIIFSSQNIEATMMRDIFNSDSVKTDGVPLKYEKELSWLSQQEASIATRAVGAMAVSEQDAAEIRLMGNSNVTVFANGIDRNTRRGRRRVRVKRIMAQEAVRSYAFFVGSAHKPNVQGLLDVMGSRLGYMPKRSRIYIAGSVGLILPHEMFKSDPYFGRSYWTRASNWGIVKSSMLQTLIEGSNCIILPITSGGGSNLKTAEAILSGRPIVATSVAFRGFESFKNLSNVSICDTPESFRVAVVERLKQPWVCAPADEAPLRESVTWRSTLAPLPEWLETTLS